VAEALKAFETLAGFVAPAHNVPVGHPHVAAGVKPA
jgi:hypothetical protein